LFKGSRQKKNIKHKVYERICVDVWDYDKAWDPEWVIKYSDYDMASMIRKSVFDSRKGHRFFLVSKMFSYALRAVHRSIKWVLRALSPGQGFPSCSAKRLGMPGAFTPLKHKYLKAVVP
jgi:hypothetical protein